MSTLKMTVEGTELLIRCDVSKLAQMNAKPSASGKTRILASARFEKVEATVCPGLQVNAVILCDPAPAKGDAATSAKGEATSPHAAAIAALSALGLDAAQIAKLLTTQADAPKPAATGATVRAARRSARA